MRHMTTCDQCGCPVEVEYSAEDITSMESMAHLLGDWRKLTSRCKPCETRVLMEHGYIKPETAPAEAPKPLTEEQVRERLPLKTLATIPFQAKHKFDDSDTGYLSPNLFN